ncbi:MAG: VWA domain-containing protein [Deltaproteobacteria bacterium]|nr:VWA domain-containing protein [Deltaproteobacteria bacterium]
MRFESPSFLALLFLTPLFLTVGRSWIRRALSRSNASAEGVPFLLPARGVDAGRTESWKVRSGLPAIRILQALAFFCAIIALARPQSGSAFREVEWSGRDILLALDISGSMQALDFHVGGERVNRLVALKKVVTEFVRERAGDRMALVVFGDKVFTQCPLTLDVEAVNRFVNDLEVGMAGQGTAIGDALGVSLRRIKDIESDSKTIILVTDGKNNSGNLAPLEAANLAAELGVKIHAVGIGSSAPAPFPVQTPFGYKTVMQRPMEYDEKTLQEIAKITSGEYFNARDLDGLEKVYAEINRLEERVEKTLSYIDYEELFEPFVLTALVFLVIAEVLGATLLLRLP